MDPVVTTPVKLNVLTESPVRLRVLTDSQVKLGVAADILVPLGVSIEIRDIRGDYPLYTGEYEVDPKFEDQTLETKNTALTDDVLVNAITVSRTTNTSGGNTVYIGGIIDA